jgi:hypothetical protein
MICSTIVPFVFIAFILISRNRILKMLIKILV